MQDLRIGGRASNAQYQYTLQGDNLDELDRLGAADAASKLRKLPELADVNSDQQNSGLAGRPGRSTATPPSRLGITPQTIDDTLYDAFGQRQVSTMYTPLNQYHVVMEVDPQFWQNPGRAEIHLRRSRQRRSRFR